jgi:hypothetical protein
MRGAAIVGLGIACAIAAGCSCGGGPGTGGRDAGRDSGRDAGVVIPGVDSGPPDAGTIIPTIDAGRDGGTIVMDPDGGMPETLRFVAMGDTGKGNTEQRDVAVQVRDLCAREGCDFIALLGDNMYDAGPESVTDPLWNTVFEEPYRDIDLPFYAVLGNHDYGGVLLFTEYGGLGNEFHKGPIEVMYTMRSARWEMPDTHYTISFGNVGFVMLDTNSILWDDATNGDQRAWIGGAIADLRADGADWIIAMGHHPYRSNGRHGNAGTYEAIEVGGTPLPIPVPILDGGNVRSFFDSHVCGVADVYLCGHDHNRQWIDEPSLCGGTEMIVSGAGASTTDFEAMTNAVHYQDDSQPGFVYIVIEGDQFTGRFVDRTGAVNFEHTFTRRP